MELFISRFNRLAVDLLRSYVPEQAQPMTLIYGPAGVGKTELLRRVRRQHSNTQVILMDALSWSRNYVMAAQEGSLDVFRFRTRTPQLMLLDQLEVLKRKTHTLEELLHTVDALVNQGGKIVACFQGELQELSMLQEKLASRFLGGMTIPIDAPSVSELAEYANRYACSRFFILPDAILEQIAKRCSNLVEVQKLIHDLGVFVGKDSALGMDEVDWEIWDGFLKEQQERQEIEVTPDNILRIINELTGILPQDIRGPSRVTRILEVRKLAIYAVRMLCGWSYPLMGDYFQRSHSMMIKSCRQFEALLEDDDTWRTLYEKLEDYFMKTKG